MQTMRHGSAGCTLRCRVSDSAALIGHGVIVLAQAPPNTTIPRVPNPPLSSDLSNLPGDLRAVPVPARRI
jgi:hypothetical protein